LAVLSSLFAEQAPRRRDKEMKLKKIPGEKRRDTVMRQGPPQNKNALANTHLGASGREREVGGALWVELRRHGENSGLFRSGRKAMAG